MIIIHFIEIIHIYGENVQKVYTDFCFLKRRFLNLYMFTLIYILLMKNTFVKHLILVFSLTMITLSCIDEYTIPEATAIGYEAEIVIEGRILAGEESVIHLSYTTPLNNEEEAPDRSLLNAPPLSRDDNHVYVYYEKQLDNVTIGITDMQGNTYHYEVTTVPACTYYAISIDSLPAGMYYLCVYQGSNYVIGTFNK